MSEAIKPLDPLSLLDLFPDETAAGALAEVLEGDAVYAPADVSPTPVRPSVRRVRTLTNSPDCVPAPATWGRTRRVAGSAQETRSRRPRRVEPGRRAGAAARPMRKAPSSDWALPF